MFNEGEKIRVFDSTAVVLTTSENEVLLYFEHGYTKWFDKSLLQLVSVQ